MSPWRPNHGLSYNSYLFNHVPTSYPGSSRNRSRKSRSVQAVIDRHATAHTRGELLTEVGDERQDEEALGNGRAERALLPRFRARHARATLLLAPSPEGESSTALVSLMEVRQGQFDRVLQGQLCVHHQLWLADRLKLLSYTFIQLIVAVFRSVRGGHDIVLETLACCIV